MWKRKIKTAWIQIEAKNAKEKRKKKEPSIKRALQYRPTTSSFFLLDDLYGVIDLDEFVFKVWSNVQVIPTSCNWKTVWIGELCLYNVCFYMAIFSCWSDVNECESDTLNQCADPTTCVNTEGSYNCSCPTGSQLQNDQRNCQGEIAVGNLPYCV